MEHWADTGSGFGSEAGSEVTVGALAGGVSRDLVVTGAASCTWVRAATGRFGLRLELGWR